MSTNRRLLLLCGLTFCLLILSGPIYLYCNHPLLSYADQAIYLDIAKLIAAGAVPYQDVFDWNPPLIMYLCVPVVWLAKAVAAPEILVFNLTVMALALLSCYFSLRLISRHLSKTEFVCLMPLVLAAAQYTATRSVDFGEREHLFVIAYLPFFILRYLRYRNRSVVAAEAFIVGLFAAVMAMLKPQFVLIMAFVELTFLLKSTGKNYWQKFLTFEMAALLEVATLYGVALLVLPATVRNIYFGQVLPMYAPAYEYSQRAFIHLLRNDVLVVQPVMVILAGLVLAILASRLSVIITASGVIAVVGLFNYLYGNQAWIYRLIPAEFASYICVGTVVGSLLRHYIVHLKDKKLVTALALTAMGAFALYCGSQKIISTSTDLAHARMVDMTLTGCQWSSPEGDLDPLGQSIIAHSSRSASVLLLGTGIGPGYPALLQSGRRPCGRYLFSIITQIDYCLAKYGGALWRARLDEVLKQTLDDAAKDPPELIVLQKNPIKAILDREQLSTRLLSGYKEVEEIAGNTIYVRQRPDGALIEKVEKRSAVLRILSGQSTAEIEASRLHIDVEQIRRWVRQTEAALDAL